MYRFKRKSTSIKSPYIIFNSHTLPSPISSQEHIVNGVSDTYTQVCGIDPGTRNCAFRIERRWNKSGIIEPIIFHNFDFNTVAKVSELSDDTKCYTNSIVVLDELLPYLVMCQYIVIESQLSINYDIVRMAQHIISYLMIKLQNQGHRPLIIEIDSKYKTRMLDYPKGVKYQKALVKKFCKDKALDLFKERKDAFSLSIMEKNKSKADDLGDVSCYVEVWFKALREGFHKPPGIL